MNNISENFERLPSNMTFGLELEFTGGLSFDETQVLVNELIKRGLIRDGWTVHSDSSVVDEFGLGAEIVSPPICDDEQTKKELKIITDLIKSNGGYMSSKVGGHVHFGLQALGSDIEVIKNFLKLYTIFEPLLYKLSTGDLDYVRDGCRNYAKPIQRRLTNVIDKRVDSLSELISSLAANLGANPTHYGENRYYGLNIQRIIETLRHIPSNQSMEEFIKKMFDGEAIYDEEGKKLSPTIEMRFRNGSSDPDEILTGVRMLGSLFTKAHDKELCKESKIKNLYRAVKKRAVYVFDRVLNINRTDPRYANLTDEEIMQRKFEESVYGDGIIPYNTFKVFLGVIAKDIDEDKIKELYNHYQGKLDRGKNRNKNNAIDYLRNMREFLVRFIEENRIENQRRLMRVA